MVNIKQSQEPKDENGKQHGEWIAYYDNGQLMYRLNAVHGISHGLQEVYFYHGRLRYRGYVNMGIKTGYWYWDETNEYHLCLI